jgi:hypothetical protein
MLQFVGARERLGRFLDLAARFLGPEVNRCAHGDRAHVPGLLDVAEVNLVVGVGIGKQLVVVQLHDEWDLVRVLAGHGAQHAQRRSHGVAAALDRQPDDVLRVEVNRIGRETRPRRMLDALIDRQDRNVAGSGEAAVIENPRQTAQHARRPDGCLGERIYPETRGEGP